ncbi:MAG: chorismate synthase [archaeon]|nr:chorismate synthase [archaeon]
MTGSEFGKNFKIITFGESHGAGIGVVIDGIKPGLKISVKEIQKELDRRRPGQSRITTQRKEADAVEIISGIFEGKTLGSPICLLIRNQDYRSKDYNDIKKLFRPGHAGYTYLKKYGIRDYRGGGRSSGRETAARVAAGAIAKKELAKKHIKIIGYVKEIAGIKAEKFDEKEIEKNNVRCADKNAAKKMEQAIIDAIKKKDSVGGIVEVIVKGVPVGLGEPVFSKLDAELAKALMSIGAVKGFEIGKGFEIAKMKGSQANDEIRKVKGKVKFLSNNAGGILGGISNGDDIIMRIAVKPTSSISQKQKTLDKSLKNAFIETKGRHDPCICPRVVPVAEAMVALVLQDLIQTQKARKSK